MSATFDLEALVTDLREAAQGETPHRAVRKILERTVTDHEAVASAMPMFAEDDVILFEDDSVSIWHCRFHPSKTVPAHDHRVHATIGVYSGAERNDFFEPDPAGGIRKKSEVVLSAGNVLQIGPSAIHAVGCASETPCLGIHVYLGALTRIDRALYDTQKGEVLSFSDENYARLTREDGSD